jgi:signal transduction histidine kinase/ligand-binding sensor domain-containing protein
MAVTLLAALGDGTVVNKANGELYTRAWQAEEGLPENMVVSVAQTPDHYLWVATHLGLFRFDGIRFQELGFVSDAGIPTGIIRVMLLDPAGRLWLAKDRGALVCLENGKVTQALTPADGLSTFQTRSMAVDKAGSVWLSDSKGSIFCVEGGRVRRYGSEEGLMAQPACWLASDLKGQIWCSQGGNISLFRDGRFQSSFKVNSASARIQTARRGGVWLCDGQQIYHAREGAPLEPLGNRLPDRTGMEVTALYEDRQNRLWAGTLSQGLFYWDGHNWLNAPTSHSAILGISEDTEGNIWVGTQGGGLNRIRSRALEILEPKDGLPFSTVHSVCESAAGDIWAVGQNGLLGREINGAWGAIKEEAGWNWGPATCVAAAPAGTVYIGTRENGVIRYQEGNFAPLALTNQLGISFVRLLTVSSNGDLWIGPDDGEFLQRVRNGVSTAFRLPAAAHLRAMVEGRDGDLWVASGEGLLLRIHEDTQLDETSKALGSTHPIRTLHATADGSIWIGYASRGLGRLKEGNFLLVRESDGLWDDYVSQITSDADGRLWLAGNRGIFYVAIKDFDALAEGRLKRLRSVTFGRGEGLPNLQASFDFWPNATRTQNGNLLMTMLSGLAVVNLAETTKEPQLPPVVLEQVTANGQVMATHDHLAGGSDEGLPTPTNLRQVHRLPDLGPGVRQMDIEYTAFNFAAPDNLEFRYQLKGRDSDWVQAGNQRAAHFGTLSPGEYSFTAQARSYDGDWNEAGALLSFRVRPYFWQTWWFKSGSLMALLALTGGAIRYVERKRMQLRIERLEREHAVERERARIAKDIHDELGSQLTGITILSDLAQSADAPRPEILSDMRKIGAMSRGLTRSLAEIVWAVNPRNDNLESFVTYACHFAEEFLRPAGMRCFLEVPEVLPPVELSTEFRHNLFMMMKEAVNNVVKHARATQVRIRISMDSGRFKITIADDGCGFHMPTTPTTGERDSGLTRRLSGNGLENMRHRIESLGGEFNLHSAPGAGTKIEATLTLVREQ